MQMPRLLTRSSATVTVFAAILILASCNSGSGDDEVVPTTNPVLTTLRPELTTTTTEARQQRQFYVIQPGDTLGAIAASFNVSVESLMAENGIEDTVISVGEQLLIPPPQPDTTTTLPG
ncbi:MAG: LysM peptidoglycan-binding domain-containing protein [Acidimicrobiales bacterium]|jgi:LysM repeat protein